MMTSGLLQRQSQKQALAPQVRQGLKLLAMSLPELRSELVAEMAKNPVIDDVEPTLEKATVSEKQQELVRAEPEGDYPDDDFDARDVSRPDAEALDRRNRFFDNQTATESLERHLAAQLPASNIDERDLPLAEMLIGELNSEGRFDGSLPDLVMVTGESEEKLRAILAKIRELDPPGCGATTLAECLSAQLDKIADPAVRRRVAKLLLRLDAVAAGEIDDPEALRAIRSLDPRPGLAYRTEARGAEYVNPEVHAVRGEKGWVAQVDARSLPEIRISPRYLQMLEDPKTTSETKAYIREKIAAAKAIVEAVARRRDTIRTIAQTIFDRQPGFFEGGLKALKPLTMQEVARAVGVDESTVSRTVNGKYASTPKGTVELRRFFVSGVATATGEAVSRDLVLQRLRDLVAQEDPHQPLSDEKLSSLLQKEGFAVKRRTVAKYRDLAGIPRTQDRRLG